MYSESGLLCDETSLLLKVLDIFDSSTALNEKKVGRSSQEKRNGGYGGEG